MSCLFFLEVMVFLMISYFFFLILTRLQRLVRFFMQQIVSTTGVEGMRYLEVLLDEVGARSTASSNSLSPTISGAPKPGGNRPPASSAHIRDCLDANVRSGAAQQHGRSVEMSSIRRSPSPANLTKGALLIGKGEDTEARYFGKEFITRTESPGPIYDPPLSSFDPHVGASFSKAPKRTIETQSFTSEASELVLLPGSVGRQVSSLHSNASTASFPRASRFNAKLYISRVHHDGKGLDSPSPTAYQPSCDGSSTNDGRGAILCGGRVSSNKLFISRAHTADCIGIDSPGPIYHPSDNSRAVNKDGLPHPFDRPLSTLPHGPAVSFSGHRSSTSSQLDIATDVTDPTCRCQVVKSANGKVTRTCVSETAKPNGISRYVPAEPFISHAHSKVQSTANTPGPAYYHPSESHTFLEAGPMVSFTKAKLDSGSQITSGESTSPGPKYNPKSAVVNKNVHGTTFGSKFPHEDRNTRFSENMFLGKDFAIGAGRHSPGPVYDPHDQRPAAAAVTMTFKEAVHDSKKLFPGPLRNRYISQELARENLGCYSPGPKYDIRGDIASEGVAFSVPKSAKLGQPNPSAAGARDRNVDGDAAEGQVKPKKKKKEVLLYPKDDYLSTAKKGPVIHIAPNPEQQKARKTRASSPEEGQRGSEGAARSSSPRPEISNLPRYTLVEKQYPSVSFSKNSRLPPTRTTVQPGPTQYTPNWVQVEKQAPAIAIGIL